MTRAVLLSMLVYIGDVDSPAVTVRGREAWALRMLLAAGERGCTPIDHPGPRWSGYIHDRRKLGFVIETIRERHGGAFPGDHALHVLRSSIVILDQGGRDGAESHANPSVIVRGAAVPRSSQDNCNKRTSGQF
jgi:hypothetical protein